MILPRGEGGHRSLLALSSRERAMKSNSSSEVQVKKPGIGQAAKDKAKNTGTQIGDGSLGMNTRMCRRDFLNSTLLASGSVLLNSVTPLQLLAQQGKQRLLGRIHRRRRLRGRQREHGRRDACRPCRARWGLRFLPRRRSSNRRGFRPGGGGWRNQRPGLGSLLQRPGASPNRPAWCWRTIPFSAGRRGAMNSWSMATG